MACRSCSLRSIERGVANAGGKGQVLCLKRWWVASTCPPSMYSQARSECAGPGCIGTINCALRSIRRKDYLKLSMT
jgi:hypothetical protein